MTRHPTPRANSPVHRPRLSVRLALGFTLVELMIVISVLGILAALVVPRYVNAKDDAVAASLAGNVKMIRERILLFEAENNAYPDLIDPGWFAGGIPEHPENNIGLPLIQVSVVSGLDHPASKVIKSGVSGAYFYNSAEGTFQARVADKGSAVATLDFYNRVNNSSELNLGNYGGGGGK